MSKLRDAAQKVLEALESAIPWIVTDRNTFAEVVRARHFQRNDTETDEVILSGYDAVIDDAEKAITALRAALAELEYKDMSNTTPEALRLARMIEHYNAGVASQRIVEDYQQAAAELRRLYFENEKLRAALAEQPAEQEPVAWWHRKSNTFTSGNLVSNFAEWTPLYAAPQPRRRLTEQEICEMAAATPVDEISCHADTWHIRFGRAIEAAVWGEKT